MGGHKTNKKDPKEKITKGGVTKITKDYGDVIHVIGDMTAENIYYGNMYVNNNNYTRYKTINQEGIEKVRSELTGFKEQLDKLSETQSPVMSYLNTLLGKAMAKLNEIEVGKKTSVKQCYKSIKELKTATLEVLKNPKVCDAKEAEDFRKSFKKIFNKITNLMTK